MLFNTIPLVRRLTPVLLSYLLLSPAVSVAADDGQETRWYDVEVILFSQKSQQFRDSELWPIDIALPEPDNARPLLAARHERDTAQPVPFSLLDKAELTLGSEAARIDKAPELELLLHLGWRQPGLPQEQAVSVQVNDDMLHGGQSRSSSNDGVTAAAAPHRLEGTLKLVLSRYLHIYADLLYREPLPQSSAYDMLGGDMMTDTAPLQTTEEMAEQGMEPALFGQVQDPFNPGLMPRYRVYHMQQSRRMRSTELHYLDHPVLGMIIRVNPYQLPEPETAQEESAS